MKKLTTKAAIAKANRARLNKVKQEQTAKLPTNPLNGCQIMNMDQL